MSDITRFDAHVIGREDVEQLETLVEDHGLAPIIETLWLLVCEHQTAASYYRHREALGIPLASWNKWYPVLKAAHEQLQQQKETR